MTRPHNLQQDCNLEEPVSFSDTQAGRQVNSAALLGARDALTIKHQDEVYILRRTRAGKLILTK